MPSSKLEKRIKNYDTLWPMNVLINGRDNVVSKVVYISVSKPSFFCATYIRPLGLVLRFTCAYQMTPSVLKQVSMPCLYTTHHEFSLISPRYKPGVKLVQLSNVARVIRLVLCSVSHIINLVGWRSPVFCG